MHSERTNARFLIEPQVARDLAARHGPLKHGNTPRGGVNRALVINRDLARYYDALATARRALRPRLSRAEQLLICDVLRGTYMEPYIPGMIALEVEDALPDNIAAKWHVAAAPLLATLRGMSEIEERALIDAVERWWLHGDRTADVL